MINQKLDNGGNTLIIFFPSILSRNMFAQHIRGNGVGEGGDHAGGKPSLGTGLLNACAPTAAGWQTGRGPGGHSMGPQEARGDKWGIWGHRGHAEVGGEAHRSGPQSAWRWMASEQGPSCGDCSFPGLAISMPLCPAHSLPGHSPCPLVLSPLLRHSEPEPRSLVYFCGHLVS